MALISVHSSPLANLGTRDSGGMNVYVLQLSRHLARLGVKVDVFTRRASASTPDVVEVDAGVRVVHLRGGPAGYVEKNEVLHHLPEFTFGLKRFCILQGIEYALVHSHYWLSGWVASILRHCWSIPWVHTHHTLGQVKNRALPDGAPRESERRIDVERRIVAAADRLLATSQSERHDLLSLYQAPRHKIDLVPCGVDVELFHPGRREAARRHLGLPSAPTLLFVGRMDEIKGIGTLLRALTIVRQAVPAVSLVVVGGDPIAGPGPQGLPPSTRRVAEEARELGIGDCVRFVGPVPQPALGRYYAAADVCVVPSFAESFGMVAVEAMACGRPVVASDVGGLRTTIRDHVSGILVPPGDPHALARPIVQLLNDTGLSQRIAAEARRQALRFDWRGVTKRVLALYRGLSDWRPEISQAAI